MSNVLLQGLALWPRPPETATTNAFASGQALVATNRLASIFQAPKTGNIVSISWQVGAVVVGATMDVRLETVSTSTGDPTGVLSGTNTNGAQVVLNTDSGVAYTTLLTQPAAVVRGALRAVVIVAGAGANLAVQTVNTAVHTAKFPYSDLFTVAWAKIANPPILAFTYDDGTVVEIPGVYFQGLNANQVTSFGSASAPNEKGLKFTLPFGASLAGFWLWTSIGHNVTVNLYDTDGTTLLKSATVTANVNFGSVEGLYQVLFSSSISLVGGSAYRLTMKATNATADISFIAQAFLTAVLEGALDGGTSLVYTSRTGTGAWTDDPLIRPALGLIIEGWDTTSPLPTSLATNRTLWRELTNEKSTTVIPDSIVDTYINLGCQALNEIARYHYTDATIALTAEVQEYTLPGDFVEAFHLTWNSGELQRSSLAEWRRNNLRWQQEVSEGALAEWAVYRDKLVLRAKPSAAAIAIDPNVTLRYISTPPPIANAGFEQLLSQHQYLPVFYGVYLWSSSHPDSMTAQQRAAAYLQQFNAEAEKVALYYQNRDVSR